MNMSWLEWEAKKRQFEKEEKEFEKKYKQSWGLEKLTAREQKQRAALAEKERKEAEAEELKREKLLAEWEGKTPKEKERQRELEHLKKGTEVYSARAKYKRAKFASKHPIKRVGIKVKRPRRRKGSMHIF